MLLVQATGLTLLLVVLVGMIIGTLMDIDWMIFGGATILFAVGFSALVAYIVQLWVVALSG